HEAVAGIAEGQRDLLQRVRRRDVGGRVIGEGQPGGPGIAELGGKADIVVALVPVAVIRGRTVRQAIIRAAGDRKPGQPARPRIVQQLHGDGQAEAAVHLVNVLLHAVEAAAEVVVRRDPDGDRRVQRPGDGRLRGRQAAVRRDPEKLVRAGRGYRCSEQNGRRRQPACTRECSPGRRHQRHSSYQPNGTPYSARRARRTTPAG